MTVGIRAGAETLGADAATGSGDAIGSTSFALTSSTAGRAVLVATFTAPLAAVTMGSLDDADQGVASGVNNAMGQLAGLLAVVILPTVAGLAGVSFGGPEFAPGGLVVAVFALRGGVSRAASTGIGPADARRPT